MLYAARAGAARQSILQFLSRLLTQGALLVLAAWALQREEVVRDWAGPYAGFFCFGALSAAVLVSWYYDHSRLLAITTAVTLSAWRLGKWSADSDVATLAAFLLPINFVLFAALKERGVLSIDGFLKIALIAAQVAGVAWFAVTTSSPTSCASAIGRAPASGCRSRLKEHSSPRRSR